MTDINDAFEVASNFELMEVLTRFEEIDDILYYLKRQETGAAELYAHCYQNLRLYKEDDKSWYRIKISGFWEADGTSVVVKDIGDIISSLYLEDVAKIARTSPQGQKQANDLMKQSNLLRNKRGITNIIDISKSDLTEPKNWDEYENGIIACENGIIDENGQLRNPTVQDRAKAKANVEWRGLSTDAPLWHKTISEIFSKDYELIAHFQRLMGYIISGSPKERVLPIFYGAGANGKSLLLNIISEILGKDYSFPTSANSIMEADYTSSGSGHNTFVYTLQGKRLVLANESKEGQSLDVGLVKTMTGGDEMSARKAYGKNIITFKPTHTVILITNHLPHISADDQAIWDRVLPIEFANRFIENPKGKNEYKRDKNLSEKILETERAGVMAWLIRGYLEWKKQGLNTPESVKNQRKIYRTDEDDFGLFIDEKLDTTDPNATETSKALYSEYGDWCISYGTKKMSQTAFGRRMNKRFEKIATVRPIKYKGIKISSIF